VLEHHVARLAKDHANALRLAEGLAGIDGCAVDPDGVQTNMVYVGLPAAKLEAQGILVYMGNPMRLVTHLGVSAADVERALNGIRDGMEQWDLRRDAGGTACRGTRQLQLERLREGADKSVAKDDPNWTRARWCDTDAVWNRRKRRFCARIAVMMSRTCWAVGERWRGGRD
jgi:hypothetical protein